MASEPARHHGEGLDEFRAAVADDLAMLAVLHDAEPDAGLIHSLRDAAFPRNLGLKLQSTTGTEATELMLSALGELPSVPEDSILDGLAVDFAYIYLTYKYRASPYESVWLDDEQLERQAPMFEVREYYKRHALAPRDWRKRADDHLVLELQFLVHLFGPAPAKDALNEAARFMDEHLLRWLMPFATQVANHCATRYFAAVALLTAAYCEELRELLVHVLEEARPSPAEIDARMRPKRRTESVPVQFVPGVGPSW